MDDSALVRQAFGLDTPVRKIPWADCHYVSSAGRVFSVRRRRRGVVFYEHRYWVHSWGYLQVNVRACGRKVVAQVHVIVAELFLPPPSDPSLQVRHLNGNPADCDVSNLEWGTQKQNMEDARRHGTLAVGERNGGAKLVSSDVVMARQLLARGLTVTAVAKMLGVARDTVGKIKRKERWRCLEP